MLSVFLIAIIGVSAFVVAARGTREDIDREKVTDAALAQAKAALIGYAAAVPLTGPERPGDMPCPDRDNDGIADPPCASEATSIGRLPWRTLGLPDLRDRSGERLWYAVSAAFINNPRTTCSSHIDAGCLNSDSRGTLTVRTNDDSIAADGTNPDPFTPSGAIAVIIAPGDVLIRQGAAGPQFRECRVGTDCDATGRCTDANTPTCNPINYLDVAVAGSAEDNANFTEASANGFIMGPVRAGDDVIVNDRIAMVTYQDLMPLLERRVVREVRNCLDQYATTGSGRYPWAADTTASGTNNIYADVTDVRAGRIPDTMVKTNESSGTPGMSSSWPLSCAFTAGGWWTNWKLHVFYSVADSFKPAPTIPTLPCLTCLVVETAGGIVPDARYIVMIGGRRLAGVNGGQPRNNEGNRSNPANYLELENNFTGVTPPDTPDWFRSNLASSTFNDVTIYK